MIFQLKPSFSSGISQPASQVKHHRISQRVFGREADGLHHILRGVVILRTKIPNSINIVYIYTMWRPLVVSWFITPSN